ncbi:2657_t:CDS:2, partial [Acaulospora morrowiae]
MEMGAINNGWWTFQKTNGHEFIQLFDVVLVFPGSIKNKFYGTDLFLFKG